MHPRLRTLLATSAVLLASQTSLFSQDYNAMDELVTEAPITFQITFTTNRSSVRSTATGSTKTTTALVTRLTHLNVLEELLRAGIIPGSTTQGWSLVAVRPAPADLVYLDSTFRIYAVNPTLPAIPPATLPGARVLIPASKFTAYGMESVERYTERTQGQYVLSSSGAVTNYSHFTYNPTFTIVGTGGAASTTVVVGENHAEANATISFATREVNDVFFYAINSLRVAATGSFTGTEQGEPTHGLSNININIGAPKLVLHALYPDVPFFDPNIGSFLDLVN